MFISELFTDPVYFFRVVLILIVSVSLHELAHGWAALSQGDDTPRRLGHMTLNPVVHLGVPSLVFLCLSGIVWGQMPVNPTQFRSEKWGEIIVSAAGPLMNLGLALVCVAMIYVADTQVFEKLLSLEFFYYAARINIVLFLFNLLPIPPLDGFHVFSELYPSLRPLRTSPFGAAAFMILFISGVSSLLFDCADQVIGVLLNWSF